MHQWFIQSCDDTLGPFTPSELLDKVRHGLVTPETKLRKNDSAWFAAAEIGGLFEAATRPTIEYLCPGCGGAIKLPPCRCPHCERQVEVARKKVIEHRIESPSSASKAGASMQGWLSRLKRRGSS